MRDLICLPSALVPLVLTTITSLLPAQGTAVRHVGGAVFGGAGFIQAQAWCTPPVRLCPAPILGVPPAANAGGTAYDPGTQTLWDTDGVNLIGLSTATFMAPCVVKCPPMPLAAIGVPATLLVTGLAFDEVGRTLMGVDSAVPPNLYVWGITTTGCPALRIRCSLPAGVFPAGWQSSGLAHSERNGMTFVLADNFAGAPAPLLAAVVIGAAGCGVRCVFRPIPCAIALRHLVGAAFDDCTNQFCLTDGATLLRNDFTPTPNCVMSNPQCCPTTAAGGIYYGLDLEASHPVRRGVSCTAAPCPACPAMQLTARGDPSLANGLFSLDLVNAPVGAIAFGLLGPGPCTPGLPFGCGFYYPVLPPAPFVLGSVGIGGGGVCGGSASMPIPIPLSPALCGANLCAQMLIVCVAGGVVGVGLTNGLDLTITDS